MAVYASSTLYSTPHFAVERRDADWFERIGNGILRDDSGHAPVLCAPYALVDLVMREGWGACGLDPDDIDMEAIRAHDRAMLARAARAMGSTDPVIAGLADQPTRAIAAGRLR